MERRAARGDGVNPASLYPSRFPFEFSVWRVAYCDARAEAALKGKDGLLFFRASDVRRDIPKAWVIPDKPPPPHALIMLPQPAAPFRRFASRDELKSHATAWNEFTLVCDSLAKIARAP